MAESSRDGHDTPAVAVFPCSGLMSSAGTLTAIASLEAARRCAPGEMGLFCVSALAVNVPRHRNTTDAVKNILAVDGCANRCASRVIAKAGYEEFSKINFVEDLGIEKRGPFRSDEYTVDEMERAVAAIVARCRALSSEQL